MKNAQFKKEFKVVGISRWELIDHLTYGEGYSEKKANALVSKLSDEQMKSLANKISNALYETDYALLKADVIDEFLKL